MPLFRHSIPWERLCEFSKQEFRLWTEHILRGHREPKSLDSSKRADVCAKSQTISLEAPLRNYIGETRTDSRGTQSAAIIACAETWLEKNEKKKNSRPPLKWRAAFFFLLSELNISSQNVTRRPKSCSPPLARPCERPVVPARPAGCSLRSPERPGRPARLGTSPI